MSRQQIRILYPPMSGLKEAPFQPFSQRQTIHIHIEQPRRLEPKSYQQVFNICHSKKIIIIIKLFKPESYKEYHNSSIKEKLVKKTYGRINVPNSIKTIIFSVQDNSIHHIKMSVNLILWLQVHQ